MSDRLRVGVIGVGAIATHPVYGHIPNFKSNPDVEVVAVSDVNGRRAQHVADRLDIPHVFTHYRDMLAHTELDAVSITTPNFLHAAIAIGCLEHGVDVLVEKPMALTTEAAARMIAAARNSGQTLFVGMNNRFRQDTRALKLMVQQGALGEVYYAKAGWLRRSDAHPDETSWFTSKSQVGSGPLWDTGLVMLDLSLWMLGFPAVQSVTGALHTTEDAARCLVGPAEESPYPVETSASALIRLAGNRTLLLEVSSTSMLGLDEDIYLRLDGTDGGAELHNPEARTSEVLRVHGELFGTKMEFAPVLPENTAPSHQVEIEHFVNVCLGRTEPLVTPEQAFEGVQVIEAIYQSAQEGRTVELPLQNTEEEQIPPEEVDESVVVEAVGA